MASKSSHGRTARSIPLELHTGGPWKPIPRQSKPERSAFLRENKKKARFLIDESVDIEVAYLLRRSGWNAKHVNEVGLLGHPDENVLAFATRDNRVLLTHDPDFLDNHAFPLQRNPGVVVLPGADGDRRSMINALDSVLSVIGEFREIWRATKIMITHDGTWTATMFDPQLGRTTKTRYRFPKGRDAEYWEVDE